MKKKCILFPVACVLLYVLLSSYSSGPGAVGGYERTGAGSTTGCGGGGCHSTGATASTTVTVTLLSSGTPVTKYTPGGSYTIQLSGTQTSGSFSLPRFGFQVSAIKLVSGSPANAGTLSSPTGGHTSTISGITIAEQSSPMSPSSGSGGSGTTYSVSIPWTAPSAGSGCVTLYGVLNAVNFSGTADAGDLWNNTSLTVNEAVGSITGTTSVCVGLTTTLSNSAGCGTWSSATTTVATVGATTGVVTGVTNGTATISYTAGAGNTATTTVTVTSLTTPITGTTTLCAATTTTLGNITPGGTWTSGNTGIATIGSSSGVVTGVNGGTAVITYAAPPNGCIITTTVTVNPLPGTITGPLNVCPTATVTLSDAGGGTWTSGTTTIATIGSSSGVVTGVTPGTTVITYTLPTGCVRTTTMTVGAATLAITGVPNVCEGLTTTLSNAATGGTWSVGSALVATVVPATGLVTGVSAGTTTISYTNTSGCVSTIVSTVYAAPAAIAGIPVVCEGLTTSLTDVTGGGTWTSATTANATIGLSSGIVTGVLAGTSLITYTEPTHACVAATTVTVNPLPGAITGTMSACPGAISVLSDGTAGGTWTSSNTTVATIGATSASVSALTAGTTTITYTLSTGCIATGTFTVNPAPSSISGVASVCSGSTTALTDAGGGTWTSSNTSVATVGSSSGLVTAIASFGSATIVYTLPLTGCTATRVVTVNLLPGTIAGTATVCAGSTTLFTDAGGGTWSSSATTVASVGTGGIVTGVSGGTATITYTLPTTGCMAFKVATVNPLPNSISGTPSVCVGSLTNLSDASAGGTWASGATTVATINSTTGDVNGLLAGTATITYKLSTGCLTNIVVTVNPLPGTIAGTLSVCTGSTVNLTDATAGGTWTSTSTAIATVGSATGIVIGGSVGTSTISYTLPTGCSATKTVTVNPGPGAISGTMTVCKGLTTLLSDAGGGTWSSGATTIATVGLSTGIVTGAGAGTAVITYALSTGCKATAIVTVYPLSPITGITSLCSGLTTTLSDGTTGGTWASSNTAVVTIGSTSGFVTSIAPGSSVVSYTLPTGCQSTVTVNVVSAPSAITGSKTVCLGSTSALTDAGGGTWTSSNTTIATVGFTTGIVTGQATGTANITYSLGTGCTVNTQVTVVASPVSITGTGAMCEGGTTTLSDATSGGTWSSLNTNVSVGTTGIITGITAGTAVISYTAGTGCSTTTTVTVNPLPGPISGTAEVCVGSATVLSDAGGGAWTSGTTTVATIGSGSGIVTGLTAGTSDITYMLPVTGCLTITTVTVDPLPGAISGAGSVCQGATITLSDAGGGTWSSGNTTVSVGSGTGIVTGVAAGTAVVTYTLATGCKTTKTVTISPAPLAITGILGICSGASATLSDATTGGTWSSDNTSVATIGLTSGFMTGSTAGTANITYTRSSGCQAYATATVNPLPTAITGGTIVCVGLSSTLSDAATGGSWTSGNTTIATIVSGTGILAGVAPGTTAITYTLSTGCATTTTVTITPVPTVISGPSDICLGVPAIFSDAVTGGTWSSSNTSIVTVAATTGASSGVTTGTATITYSTAPGCQVIKAVTVDLPPLGIVGTTTLCAGASVTLSDATSGGTWSSSLTTVAIIGSASGIVTGVAGGSSTISYILPTGCSVTIAVNINPAPGTISGTAHVCAGLTTSLTDATTSGTWTSSNSTIATIGSGTGVVTGVSAGTSDVSYTLSTGCAAVVTVTVDPLPGNITGTASVCVSATTGLSDAGGGSWHSASTAIAIVSGSGLVTGVSAGTTTITYTLSTGCKTTTTITVNPLPSAGTISGATFICAGTPVTLSDGTGGGSWSSSNTAVATIGATSGVVTGVATGTTMITYTVTNICGTDRATVTDTILALPGAGTITGSDSVCEGNTITVSDALPGGVWSSSNTLVATVSAGVVTGVSAGSAIISYNIVTPCGTASATMTVVVKARASCNVFVQSLPGEQGFRVFPNPSAGQFIVEVPELHSAAVITIMDMLGKVIERRNTDGSVAQQVHFNLSSFSRGSYIVKVNAGTKTFRQKIEIW